MPAQRGLSCGLTFSLRGRVHTRLLNYVVSVGSTPHTASFELDNNTAERSMRGIAIGRKNYMFVGSERGGKSAAIIYTLIETAKLNSVDPQAWLTDTLRGDDLGYC